MGEAVKLSILIATITERVESHFPSLVQEFMKQIGSRTDVEVIGFMDNRRRTVGVKRQDLLGLAKGEYLVFFDDDDTPSPDYVSSIMEVLDRGEEIDAVLFEVKYTNLSTNQVLLCKYDKDETRRGVAEDGIWYGPPCHIHVIRSEIAKSVPWLERPKGTQWTLDVSWANELRPKIQRQVKIDRPLYLYNYDPRISETLKRNRRIEGR